MEDKATLFNDSALFLITSQDRDQFLVKIADLYESARHAGPSSGSPITGKTSLDSGVYKLLDPGGHYPDSPLTVSLVCDGAQVACSENVYSFPSGTSGEAPPSVNGYPNYGCLGSEPCPAWFYMQVGIAGDIIISISQSGPSGPHDVDFICWGPFSSLTAGCDSGLTGTCHHNGVPPPTCCNNTAPSCAGFYPRGNIVDCSISPMQPKHVTS